MQGKVVVALASIVNAACVGDDASGHEPDARGDDSPRLPSMVSDGAGGEAPAFCTWAASVDAIIVGRLNEVRLEDSPLVKLTGSPEEAWKDRWQYVDDCSTAIEPALALDVEVIDALHGELSGEVEARVGREHRILFEPRPERGDDGALEWLGSRGRPLEEGQTLGLALHYIPDTETWSLAYELMFTLGEDGKIAFQKVYGWEPPPTGADGMSPEELASAIESCVESSESETRGEQRRTSFRPTAYFAAWCSSSDDSPQAQ